MRAPHNDDSNGWSAGLNFPSYPPLARDTDCDLVIVGAGYTGLSAALTLQQQAPDLRVILVDAQQPAQGASARNSGYLVDSTLNDGHLSDTGLQAYRSKYALARTALECVQQWVQRYQIECDWAECGKFHAAHQPHLASKLDQFAEVLDSLGLVHQRLKGADLAARLGTPFYQEGIWTAGAVMLNPAKLALGLLSRLSDLPIYGDTPIHALRETPGGVELQAPGGRIRARQAIVCTNATLRAFGQKRTFPLYLTASLTRPITQAEWPEAPAEYGILSAQPMGATVRWTGDRRLMIRNTAQVGGTNPEQWLGLHLAGLRKRYPFVTQDMLTHTWGGYTCISGNNANVFEQSTPRVFRAGCYNGGGIGLGILFGQQIARAALGQQTDIQRMIHQRPQPNWLPPEPALSWGVRLRLARDRRAARLEV